LFVRLHTHMHVGCHAVVDDVDEIEVMSVCSDAPLYIYADDDVHIIVSMYIYDRVYVHMCVKSVE